MLHSPSTIQTAIKLIQEKRANDNAIRIIILKISELFDIDQGTNYNGDISTLFQSHSQMN